MGIRYDNRRILFNNNSLYQTMFKDRGIQSVRQYSTPVLRYPSADEIAELETVGYTWGHGDRFYKLSHKYYGDPSLWWVIAWYNRKPTESHVAIGETIYVPLPLDRILRLMGM